VTGWRFGSSLSERRSVSNDGMWCGGTGRGRRQLGVTEVEENPRWARMGRKAGWAGSTVGLISELKMENNNTKPLGSLEFWAKIDLGCVEEWKWFLN
jgi:hypothetical protein